MSTPTRMRPASRRSLAAGRAAERASLVGREAMYLIQPGLKIRVSITHARAAFGRTVCTVVPLAGEGRLKVNYSNLSLL